MVAREVVKAEKLVDYTNKQNFAERFAKRLGAQVGEGALAALRGAPGWR
ncbi:MAG TPA: S49 family peptidase, partial [Ottowia sp.]|nr:S49 family peptidase [Ottowia sp.]